MARSCWRWAAAFCFAALACLALASFDKSVFFVAYLLLLAPLVLHLAYIPKGRIRAFNGWGDFSYGVYIYAFPIQQTLAFLFPGLRLVGLIALAAPLTVAVAALSWVLIEKRGLARKEDAAAATSRAFSLGLAKFGGGVPSPRIARRKTGVLSTPYAGRGRGRRAGRVRADRLIARAPCMILFIPKST